MKNEKSKCIVVSTCKQYVCIWIFHSSLLVPRAAGYVATRLMCRLICNLPEMNIRTEGQRS